MADLLTKYKFFLPAHEEKEEQWLREMAREGWHLVSTNWLGAYRLVRGEPHDVVYRIDYKPSKAEHEAYVQPFAQAGWEAVNNTGDWYYFRKPAEADASEELPLSRQERIRRYRRIADEYTGLMVISMVLAISGVAGSGEMFSGGLSALAWMGFALSLAAMGRAQQRIKEIEQQGEEG